MLTIEQICTTALSLCGLGDKPSSDDMAKALRTLGVILEDWAATRDVHFWNLAEQEFDVPIGDRVLGTDGATYQCIVPHSATEDNRPVTGSLYANYWKSVQDDADALVWTLGASYSNEKYYALSDVYLEDILALRLQYGGQFSPVEKVSAMEFAELPPDEIGDPLKAWVKKDGSGLYVHFWPLNGQKNAKIFYYAVKRPYEYLASDLLPLSNQWAQALYYALAVELGFIYNIKLERLNILGQKAKFEFDKAFRTNESEVDECYVKPLY